MAGLLELLSQTWPARMAQGAGQAAWGGITAPRDAYQGRLDPISPEGIARTTNLGALMTLAPGTPTGALGSAMASPERLTRAAIKLGDKIYQGPNHATAISIAERSTGKPFNELVDALPSAEGIDGFMTSAGRFVGRDEAAQIANGARQLKPNVTAPSSAEGGLMTEDMRKGAIYGVGGLGALLGLRPQQQGN